MWLVDYVCIRMCVFVCVCAFLCVNMAGRRAKDGFSAGKAIRFGREIHLVLPLSTWLMVHALWYLCIRVHNNPTSPRNEPDLVHKLSRYIESYSLLLLYLTMSHSKITYTSAEERGSIELLPESSLPFTCLTLCIHFPLKCVQETKRLMKALILTTLCNFPEIKISKSTSSATENQVVTSPGK